MEYVKINASLPEVSRVCMGTWAIGGWLWGGADDQNSIATIHAALDKGINFIDTAPVYGFGRAETVVGKALEGKRDKAIIATKVGLEWTKAEKVYRNSSKQRILDEIEDSLRRLQTDYIDLYQVHWPDDHASFEDTAAVLLDLKKQGKIRAIGVSNYNVTQMKRFAKICPIETTQPPYNLFERGVEQDIFAHTESEGITTLAYGALCRGLLSGRMRPDTKFSGDDLRKIDPKFQSPRYSQYLGAVNALDKFAKANFNKSVLALAVRWLLDQGKVIALWGARRPDQLDAVPDAFGWQLTADHMRQMDHLIKTHVTDPIGPEFMGSPDRSDASYNGEYPL